MLVSKKISSLMQLIAVPVLRPPEVDPALQVSQGGRHGAALLLLSGPLFHGFSQGPPQVALLLPVGRRRYLPKSLLHVGPYAHRDNLRSHEFYLQSSLLNRPPSKLDIIPTIDWIRVRKSQEGWA